MSLLFLRDLPEPPQPQKTAEVALQPQQKRVQDKVTKQIADTGQSRLLVYHGLGSGKTLSSIAGANAVGLPFTAVVPAALRENYKKDLEKFGPDVVPNEVISQDAFAKGLLPNPDSIVVDEAQRLRNQTSARGGALQQAARNAKSVMLLSGTPVVNSPGDLAAPLGVLTGKPMSSAEFENRFVDPIGTQPGMLKRLFGVKPSGPRLKNEAALADLLKGKVDYHAAAVSPAEVTRETVPVTMSGDQASLYRGMYEKLPPWVRWKMERDYPLEPAELKRLTGFLTGPRQVGLSPLPFMRGNSNPDKAFVRSPKLQEAYGRLRKILDQNPAAKALVFSNFIDAGLSPYQAALNKAGIPAASFTGALDDAGRKQMVEDYNNGKTRVALIGPAGTEGLSFRGTRLVQLLDPHWNSTRSNQSIGRGVRFDSHQHLDPGDRNVRVEEYRARLPRTLADRFLRRHQEGRPAADDYLARMADKKDQLNQQVLDVLRRVGSQ